MVLCFIFGALGFPAAGGCSAEGAQEVGVLQHPIGSPGVLCGPLGRALRDASGP